MNRKPDPLPRLAAAAACALSLSLSLALPAQAGLVYAVDDGVADGTVTVGDPTQKFTYTFANRYQVQAGGQTLESISSYFYGGPADKPFTAFAGLWADPNGDGNPGDAAPIAFSPQLTHSGAGWELFDIPDTTLAVGAYFFAAVTITFYGGTGPIGTDDDAPFGSSWWGGAGPSNGSIWGDFMIRAQAKTVVDEELPKPPGTVPVPAPLGLLGAGLAALAVQRRQQRRQQRGSARG